MYLLSIIGDLEITYDDIMGTSAKSYDISTNFNERKIACKINL